MNPFSLYGAFRVFILVFDFHLFFWVWMSLYLSWWGFIELLRCIRECTLSDLRSFQLLFLQIFLLPLPLFFWNSQWAVCWCAWCCADILLFIELGRGMRGALGQSVRFSLFLPGVQFFKPTWSSVSGVPKLLFLSILCFWLGGGICQISSFGPSQKFHPLILLNSSSKRVGVPIVVQWLTNPTRNHEVAGSIHGPAWWVKYPALPWAVV